MNDTFKDKDILITGGCGSIGSNIVEQLLNYDVKRIRVFDNSEPGHFFLQQDVKSDKVRHLIGDVRDGDRLSVAMQGVDIVFHAAALKHVPFCEYNPFEAVSTNVLGTKNIISAAIENNVKKIVAISTDKAVNPINTMGATKMLAEKLLVNPPGEYDCLFSSVRFGNVLNSVGSVIPIFREQIKKGGPLTLTDENMTRFFMTIPEAVELVLESTKNMKGSEIFVLKMPSVKISDLAEVMIEELAPRYNFKPEDIKVQYIGVRAGEKLYESLLTEEECSITEEKDNMFVIYPDPHSKFTGNAVKQIVTSNNVKLLDKKEIKELLYDKKII
ncbi:polysaccharide biosynthesis protein [Candidatus Woesearchaeota archaeon]|nr:polysaccharide biosynthesis protein [Candidatus Woesearchaeota archaeon]MBT3538448.1 polysaccharide biosynthesis protein [Candidatus Woesearchaeota archaeon]MBT4697011.1 polysaccharide biosynthesis protein [Candidatus Woesearchaeota archaeon]MBT7106096.1 polysaccharide biosynthesis protein [Candidatus Woesearchaeota archaeon]MBT7931006.1 polysaccharide biosynthesis protein [Candidatus Woesearchaeota archaeon]